MKKPIKQRRGIPFFYDKSESEFSRDTYERYDPMVIRQSALHFGDELWGGYPMQAVLDFSNENWPTHPVNNIVELGCGVGRWIGEIAEANPHFQCWGIDYSYQLLRRAEEVWVKEGPISVDLSRYGLSHDHIIQGRSCKNVDFGLAKAEYLPFDDESMDVVMSSFLFDRLDDPLKGLREMIRILKPSGRILMITPLNFTCSNHWHQFYPPIKIHSTLKELGLNILDWTEDLATTEPLDIRGNKVVWKSLGVVCVKSC